MGVWPTLILLKEAPAESWKEVSEPYAYKQWWVLDYEMQKPDLTECPECPSGYRYYYCGYPYINDILKSTGGGQMTAPDNLTGIVYFAGAWVDVVTLKLAKIDRLGDIPIDFTDEVDINIP